MNRAEELRNQLGSTLLQNIGGDGVPEAIPARAPSLAEGKIPTAIPVADPDAQRQRARGFWLLPIDSLAPDPHQPRGEFDETTLELLSRDITKRGLLQPIRVRPTGNNKYQIIAGERRWRAAKMAGTVKELPCWVVEQEMTEAAILEEQLVENIHRAGLTDMETAQAYKHLITRNNWSQAALAQELNLSMASVSRSLALLDLPESVRQHVASGVLPASTAYEIGRIQSPEKQAQLAEKAVTQGLNRQDVTAEVQGETGRRAHAPTKSGNRLQCRLPDGTCVTLSRGSEALTLDQVIASLSLVLTKAKKLRSKNLPLADLPAMLRAAQEKNEEATASEAS
jgi:ParB family transcriptional regulator, chromosome partitioning protein